jgi:hypothetical protein
MSFFSWLRNRTSTRSTRWDGFQTRPTTRRFRPRLEALEDRWLPSTLTVTNNLDSGAGSLRADIAAAQSGDTIVFAPSLDGKTITLTSGPLAISKNLTIQGPGASLLTISGNHLSPVFHVTGALPVVPPVVLSGLTISNGVSSLGGGILNSGTLTVSQCTLSGNSAGDGGGIYNTGALTVSQSTLNGNSAQLGGGIYTYIGPGVYGHPLCATLTNCTLSGNHANGNALDGSGGGGGLFVARGTTKLTNCTISQNYSLYGGSGISLDSPATGILTNTIVAGNFTGQYDKSDIILFSGTSTMNYCLVGFCTGSGFNTDPEVGCIRDVIDPGVGPLQNNGGPTQTMALLPGSLAIGHGNNALAPATDQRGFARLDVAGELTDIGAFEL